MHKGAPAANQVAIVVFQIAAADSVQRKSSSSLSLSPSLSSNDVAVVIAVVVTVVVAAVVTMPCH